MLFNTIQFAIFFIITYSIYLVVNHKWQNRILLVASCIFYGAWSWKFLCLMFVSITTDYICGIKIYETDNKNKRKFFLYISMFVNLFILGFFKYFNFFTSNIQELLRLLGLNIHVNFLHIILPVGISFYTFQAMSYVLDIYRKRLEPTRNYLNYALFVTYFPQLVAGPIMRARDLLPQVISPRKLRLGQFYEGCYLILWGLFLKVFVADNLAKIVDPVFASAAPYNGIIVILALYAFAFQIFGDFAGYSNIAIGLGKVMGFNIMVNFNLPYFATNPRDFWTRWHISLSTWLRDYLYIPLGGNRNGTLKTYRNLAITMLLGGLWHGAAWMFVIWGAYHGLLLIVHRLLTPIFAKMQFSRKPFLDKIFHLLKILFFFHLVCLGWLFFRANSSLQIKDMLQGIMFNFIPAKGVFMLYNCISIGFFIFVLLFIQIIQYWKNDLMAVLKLNISSKGIIYFILIYLLLIFGVEGGKEFIYFQF